jgi:hypothetical protein
MKQNRSFAQEMTWNMDLDVITPSLSLMLKFSRMPGPRKVFSNVSPLSNARIFVA